MKYYILIILIILGSNYPVKAQLKLAIPFKPQVYYGADSKSIVYELHLMDSLKRPIDFFDFKISSESQILLNDSIISLIPKRNERNRYIKYVWIEIDSIPSKLIHEIKYKLDGELSRFIKTETDISDSILTIGMPVRKGTWYMQAAPSPSSYHRVTTIGFKSKYDINQNGYILGHCNQRFAIDFAKVDEEGLLYKGEGHNNIEHNCYNQDVIAVSDGVVIGVLDSINEHEHPPLIGEIGFREFTGNLVLLDIGNGIVASYAHLIPNSIIVNIGDNLSKGDLIGKIGNSGSSTAPHLHFHLSKHDCTQVGPSNILDLFWSSEGVSYVFDSYLNYNIISGGFIERETDFHSKPFILDNPRITTNSLPYENNIIEVE